MFGNVSGKLIYSDRILHATGHSIVNDLREQGYTTRQQIMHYMKNDEHLLQFAQGVMFRATQNGVPTMLQAAEAHFETQDIDPHGVVSREVVIYEYMAAISESYVYGDDSYIRTQSGYTFNASTTMQDVMDRLPWGVESVLNELKIQ